MLFAKVRFLVVAARHAEGTDRLTLPRVDFWRILVTTPSGERSLVLIKPDAVRRGLGGVVLVGQRGVHAAQHQRVHRQTLALESGEDLADHVDKGFYPPLKAFMTSGPLVALVLSGDEVITVVRTMLGATDGRAAAAGTIRGDFSLSNRENLVHASDSPESAKRERALWFPELV